MRVLVTGNLGYIGTVLCPMLLARGHQIVGLDSDLYQRCTFGELPPEVPTRKVDIRDVRTTDLEGFEAIIHLAALSNDPLGNLNPDLTYEINYKASVRLASMAKDAGVSRFVFSSSCSTYGAAGDEMITEDGPFNPVTPYGLSKVLVERHVSELADDDFSPVFLRNATAYGVSPRLRFDLVLNNLVAWAYTTGLIYLKSDGASWRPLVHVEDIARAFLAVLEAPREAVHNQAFNVGQNKENYRVRYLAEVVAEVIPDCRVAFAPDAGPDKRSYRVDCSKITRHLPEFKPVWDVHQGAQQLLSAYQQQSVIREEFEGPRFKRIDHIKMLLDKGILDEDLRVRDADEQRLQNER